MHQLKHFFLALPLFSLLGCTHDYTDFSRYKTCKIILEKESFILDCCEWKYFTITKEEFLWLLEDGNYKKQKDKYCSMIIHQEKPHWFKPMFLKGAIVCWVKEKNQRITERIITTENYNEGYYIKIYN